MNKEQSADDPLRGFDSCKKSVNSTISMSYPDVVPQQTQGVSGSIQSN